jgi:hypothetical protein
MKTTQQVYPILAELCQHYRQKLGNCKAWLLLTDGIENADVCWEAVPPIRALTYYALYEDGKCLASQTIEKLTDAPPEEFANMSLFLWSRK